MMCLSVNHGNSCMYVCTYAHAEDLEGSGGGATGVFKDSYWSGTDMVCFPSPFGINVLSSGSVCDKTLKQ